MHQDGNATNRNKNIHDFDITRYVFYYQESFLFFKKNETIIFKETFIFSDFFRSLYSDNKKNKEINRNTRASYRNDT